MADQFLSKTKETKSGIYSLKIGLGTKTTVLRPRVEFSVSRQVSRPRPWSQYQQSLGIFSLKTGLETKTTVMRRTVKFSVSRPVLGPWPWSWDQQWDFQSQDQSPDQEYGLGTKTMVLKPHHLAVSWRRSSPLVGALVKRNENKTELASEWNTNIKIVKDRPWSSRLYAMYL